MALWVLADDRVNCVTYDNSTANSLSDPPAPSFQQLTATSLIGPGAKVRGAGDTWAICS